MRSESTTILVITPTYNRANLLPDAIQSVFSQEYRDLWMVVVDDGSTDKTSAVCSGFACRYPGRFRYIRQKHGGCSAARNRGLQEVDDRCGFVCFLDSDDRLLPGKLSREAHLLQSNPEAGFTFADSLLYDEVAQKEYLRPVAGRGRPGDFPIEHFLTNEAKCAALLYRAGVVSRFRFREDLRYNEDSEFLQRVAIEHKGVYCPEPSCWVRWHADSKSRNFLEIQRAVLRASLDILEAYPDFYASFAQQADGRIHAIKCSLFRQLMLSEHWNEAAAYATTPLEKLLVAIRSNGYYWLRGQVGAALSKLR
jgi:glycosyltransferase involved in cell wall biosynthesis